MRTLLRSRDLGVGVAMALLAAMLTLGLPGPFHELEKSVLKAKYLLRGEHPADSSVVIVYFDNADIAALGDLPVKRSYYALLLHALHASGAAAVGLDIGLVGPDVEHPEYDALLASVIAANGDVVLGGYFRTLGDSAVGGEVDSLVDRFTIRTDRPYSLRFGADIETPLPALLAAASGFGHTNYVDANTVPYLVRLPGERYLPSFGAALYQARARALRSAEPTPPVWADAHGDILLNYPGSFSAFRRIPAVEFLRAYDDVVAGRSASLAVGDLRGTTVVIGIVAEGRGSFVETPFSKQLPSVAMHATFLDNMLRDRLLRESTPMRDALAALVVGLAAALLLTIRARSWALAAVGGLCVAYAGAALAAFAWASYSLAVAPAFLSVVLVTVATLWAQHRTASSRVDEVVRQHEGVSGLLREKELALAKLERELSDSIHRRAEARTAELTEEIRRYKLELERLRTIADDLRPAEPAAGDPVTGRETYHGIVYDPAGPMAGVVGLVRRVADSNATVLILGESGTGKELVARAIHEDSPRKGKPFVAVNCGALAESLLESELFGYERGAFTGAVKDRQGRFEFADGGTIFLDEIGEISEAFQVKLLRVLQDGTFERVGGNGTRKADVRIIAATNRDLRAAVEQKKFREDLFYRLNVVTVTLPPLREREGDLRLLVREFLAAEGASMRCSETAMDAILRYPWKGNVRELQSVIKRSTLLARSVGRAIIQVKDLPPELAASAPSGGSADLEAQVIRLMREKEFSRSAVSETAEDLGGLNRGTVAEYVRGWVFKTFAESLFSIDATVEVVAGTDDSLVRKRVRRKVNEYLANAIQYIDPSKSFDEVTALSRPKYKNLPQRYHKYLDEVLSSAYKGHWKVDEEWNQGNVE